MRFISTRMALWVIGLLYVVMSLLGQTRYTTTTQPSGGQIITLENPVTETQIGDLARRVQQLEENKTETRLTKIETILEQAAKSSDSNQALLRAILVPLGLLCMEAFFRVFMGLPKLSDLTKKR